MLAKLAWLNLWRNKLRTSIIVLAIALGFTGVIAMIGFMNGFMDNMVNNAIVWQSSHIQIHNKSYSLNPDLKYGLDPKDLTQQFNQISGIQAWSARQIVQGTVSTAKATRGINIKGITPEHEAAVIPIRDKIIEGNWLTTKDKKRIVISSATAEKLKAKLGSKLVLTFSNVKGDITGAAFKVSGIFQTSNSAFDKANAFVNKQDLQFFSKSIQDHELAIILNDKQQAQTIANDLKSTIRNESLLIEDWLQIQPILKTYIDSVQSFNIVFILVFVLAMVFGVINILLMSVFERTKELGVLMAIGMEKHAIRNLILLESLWISAVGSAIGIGISLFLHYVFSTYGIDLSIASDGLSKFGIDALFYPQITVGDYMLLFVTVMISSVIAALYPARQILKQTPVEAMEHQI